MLCLHFCRDCDICLKFDLCLKWKIIIVLTGILVLHDNLHCICDLFQTMQTIALGVYL